MIVRKYRLFTAIGLFAVVFPGPSSAQQVASAAAVQAGVAAAVRGSVKLVSFKTPTAVGKNVSSGDPIYLGDKIEAGPAAGLQVMLMDETVFTIGPDSAIVIDRFIYDPAKSAGKVGARVLKGVFRFVSGKVAANKPSDMEVKLPNGTIGIRGTSAGGFVRNGVSEVVLLGPGAGNNVGEPGGRIIVAGASGQSDVHITRVNYGTRLAGSAAPTAPVQWDAAKMRSLAGALRTAQPNRAPPAAPAQPGGQSQQDRQQEPGQQATDGRQGPEPQNARQRPATQQAAVGATGGANAAGPGSIARRAGQDVGVAGQTAPVFARLDSAAPGKKKSAPLLPPGTGPNDQLAAIQQLKNTLSGITTVAQLNAIGGGTFNYATRNHAMKFNGGVAASTYDFAYSIDFNARTHTGSVTINTNSADTGFVTASGTFNLLQNPFNSPAGALEITEGGATTHVPGLNANDNRIEVKYKFINDGGIATRIKHSVNYGEPQGSPTRTLTGEGVNTR